MKLISAIEEKCTHCGICTAICPMLVIELDENKLPAPTKKAELLCINCGYCVDACPTGALLHRYRKRSTDSGAAARRQKLQQKIRAANMKKRS